MTLFSFEHSELAVNLKYTGIANECVCIIPKKQETIRLIGDHISSTQVIQTGVPKGSVFGPFLFLLYINNLNKYIKNLRVYLSADDTNILLSNDHLNY